MAEGTSRASADERVQTVRRAKWLGRAVLWLRAQERHFLADQLACCVLEGAGWSLSEGDFHHMVTLVADGEVIGALSPFAGETGDRWIGRAFQETGPLGVSAHSSPARVTFRKAPSPARLSGTLAGPAKLEINGLRFRSHTEARVAQAFDDANVLYLPLPVAVRHRVKFEVDFLVVHMGRVGVLEVDGPTHTPATRAREDSRAAWFQKSGITLFRHYPASAVDQDAAGVVSDFLNDLRGPRL